MAAFTGGREGGEREREREYASDSTSG